MVKFVLLYYNKVSLTLSCIESILSFGYSLAEILCVDNGSLPDVSVALLNKYPGLQIHRIETNGGYSMGFNTGVTRAFDLGADDVLFLTNDTRITPLCFENCKKSATLLNADIVAPKILNEHHGGIDSIGGYFEYESIHLLHHQQAGLPELLGPVDYVPGTALWLNKRAFRLLGGMDETYFMFWEDVDFSFRAHSRGLRLGRCYEVEILHSIGKSTRKKPYYTTYLFQRNRIRFAKAHLSPEQWKKGKVLLENELNQLIAKWTDNDDELRLEYSEQLRAELVS